MDKTFLGTLESINDAYELIYGERGHNTMAILYHDRDFLNVKGHGGLAAYNIQVHSGWGSKSDKSTPVDGTIEFSDCSSNITLSFSVETVDKHKRAVAKVRKLRDAADRLLNYLEGLEVTNTEAEFDPDDDEE